VTASKVQLTAGRVAAVVGGDLAAGDPASPIDGFSIDTRTLKPGDLFFGIRGERFDGDEFTGNALEAGAMGVVTARTEVPLDRSTGTPVAIVVRDTTEALQALARHVRRESKARVVAITGSAGKTTTKEAAAAFLTTRYRVFRNRGNLNNHIGLPLSLLELRHGPEVAVVEFGMSHTGEIATLTAIAEPEVRVWTNVAEAHLEFFSSVEEIADTKAEILGGAQADTLLVANADDPRVTKRIAGFHGRVVTFGIDQPADVRATNAREMGIDGTVAVLETYAGSAEIRVPLVGRGNLANVLAAAAVAIEMDVPVAEIAVAVTKLKPVTGRGEVVKLKGVTVVDDSYNSNPRALEQALNVLAQEAGAARLAAVLGEMLELGPRSREFHEYLGRRAAETGLAWLVTVGGDPARAMAEAAVAAGMDRASVRYASASDEAPDAVLGLIKVGDLVLVKGSRGVRTEKVVSRLKVEFS
jgi:UDP-N-acetylmuramoyl-tripeptide--D-alanyl-D-alanine ligase